MLPQASNPDKTSSQETPTPEETQGAANSGAPEGASPPQDGNPGPEQPETKGTSKEETPVSFADVIQKVIPDAADESSVSAKGDKPAGPGENKPGAEGPDPKASEAKGDGTDQKDQDEKLPFHNHPRWKELIAEKNDLKSQVEDLQVSSQFGRVIHDYMEQTGLSDDNLTELLQIGAGALTDPQSVIPRVEKFLNDLKAATGDTLPDDLQDKVNQGYITEEDALEMSRLRASQNRFQAQQRQSQDTAADQERRRATDQVSRSVNAANTWAQQRQKDDAGFAARQGMVSDRATAIINALVASGQIKRLPTGEVLTTPEQAVEILQMADRDVLGQIQKLGGTNGAEPKPEIKPSPLSTQTGTSRPNASVRKDVREAKSLAEAIDIGLGG